MDYKELSKRMRKRYLDNLNGLLQKPDDVFSDCNKAATAITDLLARVEAAEKEVEWKNKVIEAAERRFIDAEAENEKLKNCRNQCKIVCLLEKYNEMEEKMIKEKERAEKAERERDAAMSCIFEIEDDLDRGNDNGWSRKHIRDWELRRANITLKGETHEDPV